MKHNKFRFTKTKTLAMTALLMASAQTMQAQLVINELMQSNIDCIMDDMNQFPDSWVELYNAGTEVANLSEYSIGTSDNMSKAWRLPVQRIEPGKCVIIYCDKEATGLHTDFRLESGKGGNIYLFRYADIVDNVVGMKKQPAPNIAYGRKTNGAADWGYMLTPTPGADNAGGTSSKILGEPVFSESGKVKSAGSSLRIGLSLPEDAPEGTEIRYTTDGSEPTLQSPLYEKRINIRSTTVLRAKLFNEKYLSPRSTVQSYIMHPRNQTLPVISIATDDRYLNDSKIGIYSDAIAPDGQRNYEHDWRRPMNIEMYETDGSTCAINQLIEARIQGGATRSNAQKSLALYANKRFGEKRLAYEFFPDQRPGQTNYKSLLLRNAGNDFDYLYMRDAVIQRTMSSNCDIDWQAWRPAIVYINGEYRGILNIRERSNDDNIFTNYDELEDIDMIENWWDLKVGTWDNYNAFKAFYTEHGHTLAEYEKWMDTEEFINLMAANLYYCNLDFPGNNIVMWRPTAEGGRWRFIMKDTDFGLGLYGRDVNYNTLEWLYNNSYDPGNAWANTADATRLFRRLMDDPDFKREFIDHCAIYMGTFMNEKGTRKVWDPMYELIRSEYPSHRELFNRWWPNYSDELRNARTWLSKRTTIFYNHLSSYYKLGTPKALSINQNLSAQDLGDVQIRVNGIPLSEGVLNGQFWPGRQLKIESVAGNEKKVVGWNVTEVKGAERTTQTISQPSFDYVMPSAVALIIEAIVEVADGIEEVSVENSAPKAYKVINNGTICIQNNGRQYSVSGVQLSSEE